MYAKHATQSFLMVALLEISTSEKYWELESKEQWHFMNAFYLSITWMRFSSPQILSQSNTMEATLGLCPLHSQHK
tara:strand:+ start:154 stop:378 length:225 start_codon:yes stop_codon:yes gene_type:complete